MFTGIVTGLGTGARDLAARRRAGHAAGHRASRPTFSGKRPRDRRLDRLLRLLPDRGRARARTGSRSMPRPRPCRRPRSAPGASAAASIWSAPCGSATSSAATSSPAMSTASAKCLDVAARTARTRFRFRAPRAIARFIAPKGSVAIDGVSLTVNEVEGVVFGVNIIPHTAAVTTFGELAPGHAGQPGNRHAGALRRAADGVHRRWTFNEPVPEDRASLHDYITECRRASSRKRAPGACSSWSMTRTARTRATWSSRRSSRRPTRSTSWPARARPDLPGDDPRPGASSSACR